MASLQVVDLGRASYDSTLALQTEALERVKSSDPERAELFLVEHDPPVITLGRRAENANLLAAPDFLAERGIEVRETGRGGDITYHGPGQLVAYPIIRLDLHGKDIHQYIRNLEEAVIRVLGQFGLTGSRIRGLTGVWVDGRKVCAIGVAARRWVSYHGLALNVCTDLDHFKLIVPCGISDKPVTSMQQLLGRDVSVSQVKSALVQSLTDVLGFDAPAV
ncbi:MAG: lipoyl(octanoyl) transferase LipB [Phycisphaerae bacterium]